MKLEDQVCNLELSKKLKNLGVKQESLFYWVLVNPQVNQWELTVKENAKSFLNKDKVSAFTASELGEMLPNYTEIKKCFPKNITGTFWQVSYIQPKPYLTHFEDDDTEANARAKMLVYLLENNLMKGKKTK